MREKICGAQLVLTKRMSRLTVPAETENTSRRQRPLQLSLQRRIAVTPSVPSIQLRSEQTTHDQQTARHLDFIRPCNAEGSRTSPSLTCLVESLPWRYSSQVLKLYFPRVFPLPKGQWSCHLQTVSPPLFLWRYHGSCFSLYYYFYSYLYP